MGWGAFWQTYGWLVVLAIVAGLLWLHARGIRGNEAQRLLDRFRLQKPRPIQLVNLDEEIARLTSRPPTVRSRLARLAFWRRAAQRRH